MIVAAFLFHSYEPKEGFLTKFLPRKVQAALLFCALSYCIWRYIWSSEAVGDYLEKAGNMGSKIL